MDLDCFGVEFSSFFVVTIYGIRVLFAGGRKSVTFESFVGLSFDHISGILTDGYLVFGGF
jgi:hypothetical protein